MRRGGKRGGEQEFQVPERSRIRGEFRDLVKVQESLQNGLRGVFQSKTVVYEGPAEYEYAM